MSRCGIVILAAGESRRLGRPKQLLELHGATLLRRCAQTALGTKLRPVVAVLGAFHERLIAEVAGMGIVTVVNPRWQAGMGTSIRAGVAEIVASEPASDAVAILLCDQPLVRGEQIEALVERRIQSSKLIAAAEYSGTLGTPVVFAGELFEELLALGDNEGGKKIIKRHGGDVVGIEIPEAATDIDTEEDFTRLMSSAPDSIQSAGHRS
ncbi:MAG: nucleotidyltransferase family protein [Tepidisphaeraceae bacterium]|jgi:molybdenum cofactor cytidylyltransferase